MLILTNTTVHFTLVNSNLNTSWCRSGSSEDKEAFPHFICHFWCRGCCTLWRDDVWLSLSFRFWFHLPLFVRYLQHMCQWELKKEVYVKVNVSFLVLSLGFHTFFQQFLAQDENILYFLLKVEKKRIDGIKSWKWFPALFCSLKAQQVSITVT